MTNNSTIIQGQPSRQIGRSLGALLAGFVAVFVLSLGTDQALHSTGVYPPWGQNMSDGLFVLATVYRVIYGILGSYITARLAPRRPMQHALIGGAIGLALSTAGAAATWNHVPPLGPHWYPLVLIAIVLPTAWLGGWLRVAQINQS